MPYQLTEPHPTVKQYAHSGRGGAGNYYKAPKTSNGSTARGPASNFELGLPQTSSKFSAGRGGAGNIRNVSERPIFSFDEELERQTSREKKMAEGAVWHVGRGGAGNWISYSQAASRKDSTSSADSTHSGRSGFLRRISSTFSDRH